MKKLILGMAILSFSILSFASEVSLLADEDNNSLLIAQSEPFNISGVIEASILGFCLSKSGECTKKFNFKDAAIQTSAQMNGVLEIPEEMSAVYAGSDFEVQVKSKIIKQNNNDTYSESLASIFYNGVSYPMGEKKLLKQTKLNLDIDFNHVDKSESNRKEYESAPEELKHYHKAVFQILGKHDDDGLTSSRESSGTGFFISHEGHALTNHHVMKLNKMCLSNRSCNMTIKQKNTKVREFNVPVRVLVCSKKNDFCLIKLDIKNININILPLEIELNKIEKKIFTLGFPGDKNKLYEDSEEEENPLTYSFGSPIGLYGTGISSSLYIAGGASGSPVMNLESGKVVGLISNGVTTFKTDDGEPGIFRSLNLINKEFGLLDYLGGEKQARVEVLIKEISEANTKDEAVRILELYRQENTSYGEAKLGVLGYSHQVFEVRKEIFKYFMNVRNENF